MEISGSEKSKALIGCGATLGAALIAGGFQLVTAISNKLQAPTTSAAVVDTQQHPAVTLSAAAAGDLQHEVDSMKKELQQLRERDQVLTTATTGTQPPLPSAPPPATTSIAPVTSSAPDTKTEELEKKLADMKTEVERLRMKNQTAEFFSHIEAIKAKVTSADGTGPYDKVELINDCQRTIYVGLRYKSLDDLWVTAGWWEVKAGASTLTTALSKGKYIYFYAYSGKTEWTGDGDVNSSTAPVWHKALFMYSEHDVPSGDPWKQEVFFRRETAAQWGKFTQRFTCP